MPNEQDFSHMARQIKRSTTQLAKSALDILTAPFGVKVVKRDRQNWNDTRNFINFARTLSEAKSAGLSVGDYIDGVMSKTPGATQATIRGMMGFGVFSQALATVVEIGPGSGRYLEATIKQRTPTRYEIYETAGPWANYLTANYDVVLQPTDGRFLRQTPDSSADLVQAHKVFSSIPTMPTFVYWSEMARVCRRGGFIVFDIMTEACLDQTSLEKWIALGSSGDTYPVDMAFPAAMPRSVAIDYFKNKGCELAGTFTIPMNPATTEVFVFRRG